MSNEEQRSLLTRIIFDSGATLRSGWRVSIFISVFVLITIFGGSAIGTAAQVFTGAFGPNSLLGLISGPAVGLAAALIGGWFCVKTLEGLPLKALGASFTKRWLFDLLFGIVVGGLTILLAVALAMVFGGLRFEYNSNAGSTAILVTLVVSLIIFVFGAAFEEALMRGYVLQTLIRSNLTAVGVIITSLIFAVGHLANENASLFSTVNTALAGFWLAAAYLKTRTLWFPFALHFVWNWVMGAFFGIEVSGITKLTSAPFLREIDYGPVWLSGGDYGLEGGGAATLALLVSTFLIWYSPVLKANPEMIELTSSGARKSLETVEPAADFNQDEK